LSDRQRVPTAAALIAVLLVIVVWTPAWGLFAFLQVFIGVALWEFYNLARRRRLRPQRWIGLATAGLIGASFVTPRMPLDMALFLGLLACAAYFVFFFETVEKLAVFPSAVSLTYFGALYVALPVNFLYWIRLQQGREAILFLLVVIFMGDTGAFLFGKRFGRRKMTPIASPNKTWEGAAAGLAAALAGALAARALFFPAVGVVVASVCGVLTHAAAQLSDPFESLFKRAAGVKDSSNLLPGHGGFLDRLDSYFLAAPFFYYFVRLFWK
jgi:phosphatidate cytidylyltransferase